MNKDIDFKLVGNLIKNLREEFIFQQSDLADLLHVSVAAVSQWENGKGIKTEKLYDIAEVFDITVEELISGRLNSESDDDYFSRNFNLEHHCSFETINDSNIDELKHYLVCCKNLVDRFYDLLPDFVNQRLSKKQNEEMRRILRHFRIDHNYCNFADNKNLPDYTEYTKNVLNNSKLTAEEKEYELSKVFELVLDAKPLDILETNNEELINVLVDLLSLRQKNITLTFYLSSKNLTDSKIEQDIVVKSFINHGASLLYSATINSPSVNYDKDILKDFEGGAKINIKKTTAARIFDNQLEISKNVEDFTIFIDHKNLSMKEYKQIFDEYETNRIKHLINYKDSDPIKYYQYLETRTYGDK